MRASRLGLWIPVVLWAGVIFALSSIPGLGTGLGTWDLVLRKLAHLAEYAVLGALVYRALGRPAFSLLLGSAYAASDEVHQAYVPGREGSALDWGIDAAGVALGVFLLASRRRYVRAVAIDLDGVLGDTRPLWRDFLADAARRYASIAPLDPDALPVDRALAAAELDRWAARGVGDWRAALERFAEERAPVHLRPSGPASAALRALSEADYRLGVFTDAPEPLARVALAQLGATRRIEALEAGPDAERRLLARLGRGARVATSVDDLANISRDGTEGGR